MAISFMSPQFAAVFALLFLAYRYYSTRQPSRNLPPGPKPIPLLGNILDFPKPGVPEYEHWLQHKDKYGPISSVKVLGTTLVIIHDKETAHELLERSSVKTSGRPSMVFAGEMCGYGSVILMQGYNDRFRHQRKLIHQVLGTKTISEQFENIQEKEVTRQLIRTLAQPDKWLDHLMTTTSATILKVTYGYSVEPCKPDPLTRLIDQVMQDFGDAASPMAWAVDILPFLQHLPYNFPGATFLKTARKYRSYLEASVKIPYKFVQGQMASQSYRSSYVSNLVEQCKSKENGTGTLSAQDEQEIQWTAVALYGAGADTSWASLIAFTMAMILFPDVQRKAQEEIDRVVGSNRLPNFDDRDKLPYVNAVVKETMRWWPVSALSFPHVADADLEYKDMHIPKGAYLIPSVWWFLHDPDVYASPDIFDPERFLAPRNEPDPALEGFGYGRRKCPGRFFATSGLYINMVQSLAVFEFKKAVGPDGKEIEIKSAYKPGPIGHPQKFQCKVAPRSQQHEDLIQQAAAANPWELSDSGYLESIEKSIENWIK